MTINCTVKMSNGETYDYITGLDTISEATEEIANLIKSDDVYEVPNPYGDSFENKHYIVGKQIANFIVYEKE